MLVVLQVVEGEADLTMVDQVQPNPQQAVNMAKKKKKTKFAMMMIKRQVMMVMTMIQFTLRRWMMTQST